MRNRKIISYVVSGPSGGYDYITEDLERAWDYFDSQAESEDGWAIGVEYADGGISFDCVLVRPRREAR